MNEFIAKINSASVLFARKNSQVPVNLHVISDCTLAVTNLTSVNSARSGFPKLANLWSMKRSMPGEDPIDAPIAAETSQT